MKINKTSIILIVLIVWAVFSIGYIAMSKWNQFKLEQMQQAYQQGYSQAIINVATEADKCASAGVPLNLGKDKDGKDVTVTIVGVSCLQKASETAAPAEQKK
jgi:hypothetical protein